MDLGLKGKVAVVTASSRGLGRAVAGALAAEGAKLALCSRNAEAVGATADELRKKYGVETFSAPCDVEDRARIAAFAAEVRERFGAVHILFANAGGPPPGTIADFAPADFEKAIGLNLLSVIGLVHAFLPAIRLQEWGRIIASTSITVKQPVPNLALSNVARVGVVAFMKTLAGELAPFNITCNTVAPGYIMTDRVESLIKNKSLKDGMAYDAAEREITAGIPAGRIGSPEEFGALVAFLSSERAGYITGETILIDGGAYRGLM
ncbi:MAG TPA: SDR family oxidoreductase [Spirochaetota bacterium]|nr:SDR family oxidoreductase [Spirochaetota bacterium]